MDTGGESAVETDDNDTDYDKSKKLCLSIPQKVQKSAKGSRKEAIKNTLQKLILEKNSQTWWWITRKHWVKVSIQELEKKVKKCKEFLQVQTKA